MSLTQSLGTQSQNYIWDLDLLDWVKSAASGVPASSVTVTNFPASQAVTGPLTDAQLALRLPLAVSVTGGGDASAANQVLGNASLTSIDTKLTSPLTVSAASLPLPTLAATSTIQTTQQTALDAIKIDVDKIPSQGQALAAASLPVVLTAAQVTTLTPPAAIIGFGLEATQLLQATAAKQDAQQTSLGSIDGKLPATLGPKSSAASLSVVQANDVLPAPDRLATGDITTIVTSQSISTFGSGTTWLTITGTWTGTLTFYGYDGVTPIATKAINQATGALESNTTANGTWLVPTAGTSALAILGPTASGTATVRMIAGVNSTTVSLAQPLPTGTNSIGSVTANAGTNLSTALLALESGNLATIILRQDRDYRALTEYVVRALLDIRTESRIQTEILFDGFNLKGDLLQYRNDAYYSGLN